MTGLFQRLARQVVGPELPRVRSAARLPFAVPPALVEHGAVPDPRAGPPAARVPLPVGGDPQQPGQTLPLEEAVPREAMQVRRTESLSTLRPTSEPASPGWMPGIRSDQPEVPAHAAEPPRAGIASQAATPRPGRPAGETTPKNPATAMEPPARPLAPAVPPPLLPELRAAAPPQPAAPSVDRGIKPRRDADASSEVHVHIGRIEVTSVAEAQPRARDGPRRGKEPMSLEQYLAKRSGRP